MILDVVIPVFNKEKQILSIYNKINEELKDIKHKFIFVDNFSNDKSLEILENIYKSDDTNVQIISMSKYNKDMAIYSGLYFSKHELVCIYDIDLDVSISYITKMYDLLNKNSNLDQVCICSNEKKDESINNKINNFILNTNYDSNKTYFRMFRQEVVSSLIIFSQSHIFSMYSFDLIGFNTEYLNVKIKNENNSKVSFKQLSNYSNNPLNIVKYFSYILLFISLILVILIMFTKFRVNNELLLVFIFFFNSLNLFILSILSTNKNRINKTEFYIRRKIGFDEDFL